MQLLIQDILSIFFCIFAITIFNGCDINHGQGKEYSIAEEIPEKGRISLVSSLNDITLYDQNGEIIAQKHRKNAGSIAPSELIPFLKDYKDIIEAIKIGNYLNTDNRTELDQFFQLVNSLPRLVGFGSNLMDGFDDPQVWRRVGQIKRLKEVSLPWENEAISLVSANNPDIEAIDFTSMPYNTGIMAQGLDTLAGFRKLSKLFLICNSDESQPLVDLFKRAAHGFDQLKSIAFQYSNDDAFSALASNFLSFKNVTELSFYYSEAKSLTKFFAIANESLRKRLQSLEIKGMLPLKDRAQEIQKLTGLISTLNVKRLSLEFDLDAAAYKPLEKLQSVEELRLRIPSSNNVSVIRELIAQLPRLKTLILANIPGQIIDTEKIPPQFLSDADFAQLIKEFPSIKVLKAKR